MVSQGYEPLVGGRQSRRELPLECVEALLRLLSIPLKSLGLGVLSLAEYVDLLHFLPWESQKQVGMYVCGVRCCLVRASVSGVRNADWVSKGDALLVAGWRHVGCGWVDGQERNEAVCVSRLLLLSFHVQVVAVACSFLMSPQCTEPANDAP